MSDSVSDFYNPPSAGTDFEQLYFSEIDNDDLFWLNNVNDDSNPPHKKIEDGKGVNMRTGDVLTINHHTHIYQKN